MLKKVVIVLIIMVVALIITFKINKKEKIKSSDSNKISILLETEEGNIKTNSFPSKEEYEFDKMDCTNLSGNTEVTPSFNKDTWKLNVSASSSEKLDGNFECNIYFKENPVFQYDYTGNYQEFTAPMDGTYKIELWGSGQTNSSNLNNGAGSYVSGEINLLKNDKLYVYVGGKKTDFNGGGLGRFSNDEGCERNEYGNSGTDVRLLNGAWNEEKGLRSRIMVAGAGGSSGYYGSGGSSGSMQGWWATFGASGASSYISGHTGCVAINSESDETPKSGCTTGTTNNSCSVHYSGKKFSNTVMIDGAGYNWTNTKGSLTLMPNPSGGTYSSGLGHYGNGYAIITYLN